MEQLIVPCEFKAVDGDINVVEGYASVYDTVDLQGDIVRYGAFGKTSKERIPKGLVKFLYGHDRAATSLLGTVTAAKELKDQNVFWFKAGLSSAPSVQDTKIKMMEGHLDRVSYAYDIIRSKPGKAEGGNEIRELLEVKLWEISVVPFAANEEAHLTMVKDQKPDWDETENEIRFRMRNPDLFRDDSFRTKPLSGAKGIYLVLGKLLKPPEGQEGSMVVQSIRFKKDDDWTLAKAKAWLKEHPDIAKSFDYIYVETQFAGPAAPDDESPPTGTTDIFKGAAGIELLRLKTQLILKGVTR